MKFFFAVFIVFNFLFFSCKREVCQKTYEQCMERINDMEKCSFARANCESKEDEYF